MFSCVGSGGQAFCCISTGIYGYPEVPACHVALRTAREWLEEPAHHGLLDRLVFCVFLDKDLRVYQRVMPQYFPPAPTV